MLGRFAIGLLCLNVSELTSMFWRKRSETNGFKPGAKPLSVAQPARRFLDVKMPVDLKHAVRFPQIVREVATQ